MRVVFRTDASTAIGSGHVMRCLVLADALAARGVATLFVCRAHPGHLAATITARGHAVTLLPVEAEATPPAGAPPHAHWLGADAATDAAATRAAIAAAGGADLLVVDHYGLDATFERALRPVVARILVIDDLDDRDHDCDLLLDQNFGAEIGDRHRGRVPATAKLLLGARHALLAPAFSAARRRRDGSLRRLLVFFGGVDAGDATTTALRAIERAALPGLAVEAVVGGGNPHAAALAAFAAERPWIRLLPPQPTLAPAMAAADLAIGAGGVTAIERAAAGLPALLLAIADNQIGPARGLARAGGALYLGVPDATTEAAIADALRLLAGAPDLLAHLAETAEALCDGRGLERVVRRLLAPTIRLRPAAQEDAERLWAWRNHPATRRHSGDPSEIPLEGHLAWFAATLKRADRALWIGSDGGRDVGVLRYDFDGDRAVVSVYLDPSRHGEGLGCPLLEAGTRRVAAERPEIRRIEAVIREGNAASRAVFAAAGYRPEESLWIVDPRLAAP